MIVDDSLLYRKVIRDALKAIPDVEVVGHAPNGKIALQKIPSLKPDLLTLDVEMPEVDGIGVLSELKRQNSDVNAIMLSSLDESAIKLTNAALDLGAFDFVLKPSGNCVDSNARQLKAELTSKIEAYRSQQASIAKSAGETLPCPNVTKSVLSSKSVESELVPEWNDTTRQKNTKIIVIGISTGGPAALANLIPSLPSDLPVPVVIVQHMPPIFTNNLARTLDESSAINVVEAQPGQLLEPGTAYIAPGGKQLKISTSRHRKILRVTEDPPENNCRPSVDYLFRSVAELFGETALGIVMTGMGNDGKAGCELLAEKGAKILLQDESSCVVYGMPRAVADSGVPHEFVRLDQIANRIEQILGGVASCK